MRVSRVTSLLPLVLVLSSLACGSPAKPPVRPPPPVGEGKVRVEPAGNIVIECTPGAAQVNIDGQDHGTATEIGRKGGLTLPKGLHRIEITLEGYRPFRFELILGDKPERLEVQLQPVKQPSP